MSACCCCGVFAGGYCLCGCGLVGCYCLVGFGLMCCCALVVCLFVLIVFVLDLPASISFVRVVFNSVGVCIL